MFAKCIITPPPAAACARTMRGPYGVQATKQRDGSVAVSGNGALRSVEVTVPGGFYSVTIDLDMGADLGRTRRFTGFLSEAGARKAAVTFAHALGRAAYFA